MTDEQQIHSLEAEAVRRRVVFIPVAVELAEQLEQGERFEGMITLRRDESRPGEAELIFARVVL